MTVYSIGVELVDEWPGGAVDPPAEEVDAEAVLPEIDEVLGSLEDDLGAEKLGDVAVELGAGGLLLVDTVG